MSESEVGVITPTFNRTAFIRQANGSVLAQTYPDFEIIISDNASKDDTAAMILSARGPWTSQLSWGTTPASAPLDGPPGGVGRLSFSHPNYWRTQARSL